MTNRAKQVGTAFETALVRWLTDNLDPAKLVGTEPIRRTVQHGAEDQADIRVDFVWGSVVIQAKGGKTAEKASDEQVRRWLMEAEAQRVNAKASHALLVTKRAAFGVTRAGLWRAHCMADLDSAHPYALTFQLLDVPHLCAAARPLDAP